MAGDLGQPVIDISAYVVPVSPVQSVDAGVTAVQLGPQPAPVVTQSLEIALVRGEASKAAVGHAPGTRESVPTTSITPPPQVSNSRSPLWGDTADGGGAMVLSSADGYGYGYGGDLYPPQIINFDAVEQEGYWMFSGQVLDDTAVEGLVVEFGGLLDGHSTTVGSGGTFTYAAWFPAGTVGVVTAVVTDLDGLQSEEVQTGVG